MQVAQHPLAESRLTALQIIGPLAFEGLVEAQPVYLVCMGDESAMPTGQGGGIVVADVFGVFDVLSNFIGIVVAFLWNYFINRNWTWK